MATSSSEDEDNAEFYETLRLFGSDTLQFFPGDDGSDVELSSVHSSDLEDRDSTEFDLGSDDDDIHASASSNVNMEGDWHIQVEDPCLQSFNAHVGPREPLHFDARPIDYFMQVMPEEIFEIMTEETNRYAAQRGRTFQPTTVQEMKAYLGIHLKMGVIVLPSYRDYWSSDPDLHQEGVASVMSRNRYEDLASNFHLANNDENPPYGAPDFDRLHKVRSIIIMLKERFAALYDPHREVAVYEAMMKFKGRCSFLQYMAAKPTKWGIKAWALCDSHSYYMLDFNVYTGKDSTRDVNVPLATKVVKDLMAPLYHKFHHVYFDSFFTSLPLLTELKEMETYACGTVRTNRRGLPPSIKTSRLRQPGESIKRQRDGVLAIAYCQKKKKVCLLSTANVVGDGEVRQHGKRGMPGRTIPKPVAILEYSDHFNGVDKNDQMRQLYSVALKAYKFWKYIFWFLCDVSLLNAYILHKEAPGGPRPKILSHKNFQLSVANGLIGGFTSRKRKFSPRLDPPPAKIPKTDHVAVKIQSKRGKRNCVLCSREGRTTASGQKCQTRTECKVCKVALCEEKGCFAKWHM